MEPITITFAGVRKAAEEIVSAVGDKYKYANVPYRPNQVSCTYVHDRGDEWTPGCLVGQIFHAMGLPLGVMYNINSDNAESLFRFLVSYGHVKIQLGTDPDAIREYLVNVQQHQDYGDTWRVALNLADQAHMAATPVDYDYESQEWRIG